MFNVSCNLPVFTIRKTYVKLFFLQDPTKAESKAQWYKSHLHFSKIINMLIQANLSTGNQECNFPSSECL